MKIKRYKGNSLEKIREVVLKELGENAVIVNIQKSAAGGVLGMGKKAVYEVIAALEDSLNADGVSMDDLTGKKFEEFLESQRQQYRSLKQSMKLLDDKLLEVDSRLEDISANGAVNDAADELCNVHDAWKGKVVEAARGLSKTSKPTKEDWHEALASVLPTAGGILFRPTPEAPPDIYVMIGSTGVGKTTSLAKLAAKCVLGQNLNVGIITIDTFRVAAVDQLREYTQLLGVEMAVAFSAEELRRQIARFQEKDVVFIDTPGRGQFDEAGIKSVKEYVSGIRGVCAVMVVPANIRREDAAALLDGYGALRPSALIISKTDEASRCDGLTQLLDSAKIPAVYLTDGQRVPEDIHVASPGVVASLIMPFVECAEPIRTGGAACGTNKRSSVSAEKRG